MSDMMSDVVKRDDLMSLDAGMLSDGTTLGSGLPLSKRTDGSVQKTLRGGTIKDSFRSEVPVRAPFRVPQRIRS